MLCNIIQLGYTKSHVTLGLKLRLFSSYASEQNQGRQVVQKRKESQKKRPKFRKCQEI